MGRRMEMEGKVFQTVMDLINALISKTQARIDGTCSAFGGLWVHLVIFSTCQVLAILNGFRSLVYGWPDAEEYTWWWGLQDFFHLGGGIVLLSAAMGFLCVVTHEFSKMPQVLIKALGEAGCPLGKTGAAAGLMSHPFGVRVIGCYIDLKTAFGFFFVLLVMILNNLMATVNGI